MTTGNERIDGATTETDTVFYSRKTQQSQSGRTIDFGFVARNEFRRSGSASYGAGGHIGILGAMLCEKRLRLRVATCIDASGQRNRSV